MCALSDLLTGFGLTGAALGWISLGLSIDLRVVVYGRPSTSRACELDRSTALKPVTLSVGLHERRLLFLVGEQLRLLPRVSLTVDWLDTECLRRRRSSLGTFTGRRPFLTAPTGFTGSICCRTFDVCADSFFSLTECTLLLLWRRNGLVDWLTKLMLVAACGGSSLVFLQMKKLIFRHGFAVKKTAAHLNKHSV